MRPEPHVLYRRALAARDALAGYHNTNTVLVTSAGPVIVRIPIPGSPTTDLAVWPEAELLPAVATRVPRTPQLLHASHDPPFQVHRYIPGDVVDTVRPRGTRLPPGILSDVVDLFRRLAAVPRAALPRLPGDWPPSGDVVAVARRLSDVTSGVHARFTREMPGLYDDLGVPRSPLASADAALASLSSRPFVLVHADVHRKNMVDTGGGTAFLDWELALWGDPVYDLAVHLHKMAYLPDERAAVVDRWARELPRDRTAGHVGDVDRYLLHEEVKSALVDSARYALVVRSGTLSPDSESALLDKLTAKIARAFDRWELLGPPNREHVEDAVRACRPGRVSAPLTDPSTAADEAADPR